MKLRTVTLLLIHLVLLIVATAAISTHAHAQQRSRIRRPIPSRRDTTHADTLRNDTLHTGTLGADSLGRGSLRTDSLKVDSLAGDSLAVTGRKSGIDTVIVYSGRDSVIFDVKPKKVRLYNDASLTKGAQKLTANYIEVDLNASTLYATAHYDSVK